MDLNELENKNISKEKKSEQPKQADLSASHVTNDRKDSGFTSRRYEDWMLILKLSVILGVLVGILLGGVSGFFIGKAIYQNKVVDAGSVNTGNNNNNNNDLYSQFDYASMWINKNKGVSIESFYADDEERFFAMQLLGLKLPELKYLNAEESETSIKDLGEGRYIIEFVEPDCAYCNKMITVVDGYRKTENALNVLTLSIKDGDISAFNKEGNNAFHLINKDEITNDLVELIVWVPTFLYVENGEVKHVTFGLMDNAEEINKNIDIAFNQ